MRLTTRTNIAMRALMYCAVNDGKVVRKSDIASACNTSENHMAQVINALGRFGMVKTTRGRRGGVTLKMPAEKITVGAVFRRLESVVPFAECMAGDANTCPISNCCKLRIAIDGALSAFYAALDAITLEDLVKKNTRLEDALLLR